MTDQEIANVIENDLWNEHRYQITATTEFYEVLDRNLARGVAEGSEPALSSALIHTRSLMEFYAPRLKRDHPDSIWWVSGVGGVADNHDWQSMCGRPWSRSQPWVKPIHVFLGHISQRRRTLALPEPEDEHGQRWPLDRFTKDSILLLDSYVDLVRRHGQRGQIVLASLERVQNQVKNLWRAQPERGLPKQTHS